MRTDRPPRSVDIREPFLPPVVVDRHFFPQKLRRSWEILRVKLF
jgi:hypothetical protein